MPTLDSIEEFISIPSIDATPSADFVSNIFETIRDPLFAEDGNPRDITSKKGQDSYEGLKRRLIKLLRDSNFESKKLSFEFLVYFGEDSHKKHFTLIFFVGIKELEEINLIISSTIPIYNLLLYPFFFP